MKICFVGKSGHSARAYQEMKRWPEAEFCGFAPASPEESLEPFKGYEGPVCSSYGEMLDKIRPDVAVVSPVFGLTGKIVTECAQRGIDVLSEKPVAGTHSELEEVEEAVKKSGIRFSAMHFLRFTPSFYEAAQKVRAGEIGKVRLITAQKSYKYGTRPDWYASRDLYTGTIPWVGIHAIDWIYYFAGVPFERVTARHIGPSPEMACLCQFEMEGGILASANLDYYRPRGAKGHGDDRVRAVGDRGIVEVFEDHYVLMNGEETREFYPTEAPSLALDFLAGKDPLTIDEIFMLTRVALTARDAADEKITKEIGR